MKLQTYLASTAIVLFLVSVAAAQDVPDRSVLQDSSLISSDINSMQSETFQNSLSIFNQTFELNDGTLWREESDINGYKFASLLAGVAIVDLAGFNQLKNLWYTQRHAYWHSIDFAEDFRKYRWMDKFGHAMDAYFASDLTAKGYRWSGLSGSSSVLLGALTGWLWMMQIEISDGFFLDWGYSWGDVLANTVGSGFFILQQTNFDLFGGLHPKISYHKSNAWKEVRYVKVPGSIIDDYEGMTFWLAINPYHYFPKEWKNNYSKWLASLGIALGVGAEGIGIDPQGGYKKFYIGLDIDLMKIPFGENNNLIKFIKSEFNFIRLPLPSLRISPSGVWYGFYF